MISFITEKMCPRCEKIKAASDFHTMKSSRDGLQVYCIECRRIYDLEHKNERSARSHSWYVSHRDDVKKKSVIWGNNNRDKKRESARRTLLKMKYGITPEDFNELLAHQGGQCAICSANEPGDEQWHIDHNHETGQIRGLLCRNCNIGIGFFGDKPWLLRAAAGYLEERP